MSASSIFEENIYQWMERVRFIDHLLFVLAIVVPALLALAYRGLRHHPFVRAHRRHAVLAAVTPPVLLVLWKIYNAVMDHYGLDSVLGTAVCAGIFLATGMGMVALNFVLAVRFETGDAPLLPPAAAEAESAETETAPAEAAGMDAPPLAMAEEDASTDEQPRPPVPPGAGSETARSAKVRIRVRETGKTGDENK